MGTDNTTTETDNFDVFFHQARQEMEEQLPAEITETYIVLSSISETKLHSSYLLEDRKQHFRVLLKTGHGDSIALLKTEAELGEKVRTALSETDGRVISYQEIDGTGYLLRQYIEGMNLTEYVERRSILTSNEIYDIMHILCSKISTLHKLDPPVIHRDIKPENIIIRAKNGRILDVYIIDYGTARMYDETKEHDTVFVGTRQTAAPEQYGFSQTDERTDIYGLGKVLCYMLSGDFDPGRLKYAPQGMLRYMQISYAEYHSMCAAVSKSTNLDPTKRYSSVKQFQNACLRGGKFMCFARLIFSMLVVVMLIGCSFFAGVYWGRRHPVAKENGNITTSEKNEKQNPEDINSESTTEEDTIIDTSLDNDEINEYDNTQLPLNDSGEIVFESELLKEAILKNLPEGTAITEETLSKVRSIRIVSKKCFGYDSEIWSYENRVFVDGIDYPSSDIGDVTDLSVIARMDNLEELYLANQNITDISALAGCPVKTLFLNGNQIEDFSVIATMPNLQKLYIGNNPITKLPDMSGCKNLRILNWDYLFLDNINNIEKLNLYELEMLNIRVLDNDYSALKKLGSLYRLNIGKPESGMMEVLPELTSLTDIFIDSWPDENIEQLESLKKLIWLSINSEYLRTLSGVEKMGSVQKLFLDGCPNLTDVDGIDELPYLQEFATNSLMIEDVTPICNVSDKIVNIRISNEAASRVIKKRPDLEEKITISY